MPADSAARRHYRTAPIALALAVSVTLAGCTVGPNYKEPAVPAQTNFSTATTQPAVATTQPSSADCSGE